MKNVEISKYLSKHLLVGILLVSLGMLSGCLKSSETQQAANEEYKPEAQQQLTVK